MVFESLPEVFGERGRYIVRNQPCGAERSLVDLKDARNALDPAMLQADGRIVVEDGNAMGEVGHYGRREGALLSHAVE